MNSINPVGSPFIPSLTGGITQLAPQAAPQAAQGTALVSPEMSMLLMLLELLEQMLSGGQQGAPAADTGVPSSGGAAPVSTGSPSPGGGGSGTAAPITPQTNNPGGNVIPNIPDGAYGGQCGKFVANVTGGAFPDATAKQFLDPNGHPGFYVDSQPRAGDVFVCRGGRYGIPTDTGHTGIVKRVNPDGTLTVIDSNWKFNERVLTHTLPQSVVDGYLRRNGT